MFCTQLAFVRTVVLLKVLHGLLLLTVFARSAVVAAAADVYARSDGAAADGFAQLGPAL